jgi:hypothetical protein
MWNIWSCSTCAVSLILALLSTKADAAEIARRDGIHRTEKIVHVVIVKDAVLRRDTTVCPVSATACAASLSGGCCPNNYACATDSCYATTRGPQTCNGRVNYYACANDVGGKEFLWVLQAGPGLHLANQTIF